MKMILSFNFLFHNVKLVDTSKVDDDDDVES